MSSCYACRHSKTVLKSAYCMLSDGRGAHAYSHHQSIGLEMFALMHVLLMVRCLHRTLNSALAQRHFWADVAQTLVGCCGTRLFWAAVAPDLVGCRGTRFF